MQLSKGPPSIESTSIILFDFTYMAILGLLVVGVMVILSNTKHFDG